MKDVQGELDRRNIPLKHVGIKDLRWPIAVSYTHLTLPTICSV